MGRDGSTGEIRMGHDSARGRAAELSRVRDGDGQKER